MEDDPVRQREIAVAKAYAKLSDLGAVGGFVGSAAVLWLAFGPTYLLFTIMCTVFVYFGGMIWVGLRAVGVPWWGGLLTGVLGPVAAFSFFVGDLRITGELFGPIQPMFWTVLAAGTAGGWVGAALWLAWVNHRRRAHQ